MKLGFIGVGNMASAIISGISDSVGADNIMLYDRQADKAAAFVKNGSVAVESAKELFEKCDIVFLAVKPQQFSEAVTSEDYCGSHAAVVTIMAGITISSVRAALGGNAPVIRVMPNAPMTMGLGAAGISRGDCVSDKLFGEVKKLLSSVAYITEVPEEKLAAVTALSGSGPAYYYLFTKLIADYGVSAGLDRETAEMLAVQTAVGSAAVMSKRPHELDELIRIVRSPNGTTEQALISFENDGLSSVVSHALVACEKRANELSSGK